MRECTTGEDKVGSTGKAEAERQDFLSHKPYQKGRLEICQVSRCLFLLIPGMFRGARFGYVSFK